MGWGWEERRKRHYYREPENETGTTEGGAGRWREPGSLLTSFESLGQAIPEADCMSLGLSRVQNWAISGEFNTWPI